MLKLVGDNPFNGVSHLSQQQANNRDKNISNPEYAAAIVAIAKNNGADGFMFSISETTLSILNLLDKRKVTSDLLLYGITPAAGEFARLMGPSGGVDGLIKKIAKQMVMTSDVRAITQALTGIALTNPEILLKSFLRYEISRIKSSAKNAKLSSLMFHEIVTDIALALDLKWVFKCSIDFLRRLDVTPGYETRNFPYLVTKFKQWEIDFRDVAIAASFNKVGFQMSPSKAECEKALMSIPKNGVLAISPLAAGYLSPMQAIDYLKKLDIGGVAVAVSKDYQARETFQILKSSSS
jgi:hypothetical protein